MIFTCRTDFRGTITHVNEDWITFARENWLPDFKEDIVVGTMLWNYISGIETEHILRMLVDRAWQGKESEYEFRCDSPDRRRLLRMSIRRTAGFQIEFNSWILREEIRTPVSLLGIYKSDHRVLVICSWCKRVHLPHDDSWVEIEEALNVLHLFDCTTTMPQLSHGICPACIHNFQVRQ